MSDIEQKIAEIDGKMQNGQRMTDDEQIFCIKQLKACIQCCEEAKKDLFESAEVKDD